MRSETSIVLIALEGTLPALDGSNPGNFQIKYGLRLDLVKSVNERRKFIVLNQVHSGNRIIAVGPALEKPDSYYHRQVLMAVEKANLMKGMVVEGGGKIELTFLDDSLGLVTFYGKSTDFGAYSEESLIQDQILPIALSHFIGRDADVMFSKQN
jgi:hypothetical protein